MKKTDLQPSRLDAAGDAAERFLDQAPDDTAVGVTTFADRASVILAPTTDRDDVRRALDGISGTRVGTALGEAVTVSLTALQAAGAVEVPPPTDPSDSPGRILVLTDGANSILKATSPEAAAERASAAGVPVYPILLGDDPGRPDQPEPAETLASMATQTGGVFAQSTTTEDLARSSSTTSARSSRRLTSSASSPSTPSASRSPWPPFRSRPPRRALGHPGPPGATPARVS